MRYFVWLSYDGSRYHGWQVQPNGDSVQAELEGALSTLLRQKVSVTGAGRTDTGVHARQMAAHFDLDVTPETVDTDGDGAIDGPQLAYRLNRLLPADISVERVERVSDDMHARFSATARTYRYYIHTRKNPFQRQYSLETHYELDFDLMNEAGRALMEYDDFGAFCKAGSDVKTTLCRVSRAEWVQTAPGEWYFEIRANRFLRNMVRAVVGTLIEVGRGRMTMAEFRQVVEGGRRTQAGESMPAKALFLEKVEYEVKR